jgi:hypothetical protein
MTGKNWIIRALLSFRACYEERIVRWRACSAGRRPVRRIDRGVSRDTTIGDDERFIFLALSSAAGRVAIRADNPNRRR